MHYILKGLFMAGVDLGSSPRGGGGNKLFIKDVVNNFN